MRGSALVALVALAAGDSLAVAKDGAATRSNAVASDPNPLSLAPDIHMP
jgi:hypothetical protein